MKTYYMFGDSLMRGVMPDEARSVRSRVVDHKETAK